MNLKHARKNEVHIFILDNYMYGVIPAMAPGVKFARIKILNTKLNDRRQKFLKRIETNREIHYKDRNQ